MDIRDLLEQRKRELYGENEAVYENMGDITGVYDEDDMGDIVEEDYILEGLSEKDMSDIELEASLIEDPDQYIDDATEDFNKEAIALAGEIYIDNLIVEEALFDCETIEDLEVVEESIKETAKAKADKAVAKVKELWKKFKAWIKNLKDVVVNMFTSGSKLVSKNKAKIQAEYNRRGNKIKLKSYKYNINVVRAKSIIFDIENMAKANTSGQNLGKVEDGDNRMRRKLGFEGEGKVGRKDIKGLAAACVRDNEKSECTVADIPLANILACCADPKETVKGIKEMESNADKFFKKAINRIKGYKPVGDGDDAKKDNKDVISSQVKFIKQAHALISSFVKAFVAEVKAANRACTAIVRRLLNQGTAGGDVETKLHKKMAKTED